MLNAAPNIKPFMIPLSLAATTGPRLRHLALRQSTLQLTIEVGDMSDLLQLLSTTFDGMIWPTRMQAIDHARKMKLSLCVDQWLIQQLIAAVVVTLPSAEIGRITHN